MHTVRRMARGRLVACGATPGLGGSASAGSAHASGSGRLDGDSRCIERPAALAAAKNVYADALGARLGPGTVPGGATMWDRSGSYASLRMRWLSADPKQKRPALTPN